MSWNSRRNSKFTNIILVIICIALIVVLGGLLLTNRKEMKQESERLQKLSEKSRHYPNVLKGTDILLQIRRLPAPYSDR